MKFLRIATHYQTTDIILVASRIVLSETERITLLMMWEYEDLVKSFEQVAVLFNITYSWIENWKA